jgi:hypothetical protein
MKQDEMGGMCSTYNGYEKLHQILVEKPKGRDHLGDVGVYGRIILKFI